MGRKRVSVAIVSLLEDPKNYSEEFNCARATEWSKAMTEEISVLEANDAWELVAKPEHDKPLHSKWMVKTKNHADCTLKRFKARLVACGNEREYDVDYVDTFSAALEGLSAQIVLALSRKVMTVDTNTLADLGLANESEVTLRLCKSLHVPKQAGHLWSLNIRKTLSKLGLVQSYTDCSMYKRGNGSDPTVGGVYVDDLPVTGTSVTNNQRLAILETLKRFGLADANAVGTPVVNDQDNGDNSALLLGGSNGTLSRPTIQKFQSLVGRLLWITRCTRPDIVLAEDRVTRRAHAPRESDWRNAKRIMPYLNGTIDVKLRLEVDSEVAHAAEVLQ
ncbi:hypothetical protein ON010_g1428 [Phytophthora cinnamomi]|nr:hypothetical protein ON010_g1428 [Phytophthora cinnamomi]